ncbi:MAG: hypothetical protein ABIG68_01810 [Acidobacteriota bacterium]
MRRSTRRMRFILPILVLTVLPVLPGRSATPEPQDPGDLDAFMAQVLRRRKVNWEELRGYVFSERESLKITGMKVAPMESFEREYIWFVRDGHLVRSPVRIDGVKVSAEEQAKAEDEYLRRSKRRRRDSLEREEFFGFKFEPGRYLYAGKQSLDGRELVAVEYFPRINDNPKGSKDDEYESMLEKTLRVKMLILPEEHQIVRMTFDNVGFEFLPYRWLVRLDDIEASMVMDKPIGDVWLPRDISAYGSISTAAGRLAIRYSREFYDYSLTDVKVKFWFDIPDPPAPRP